MSHCCQHAHQMDHNVNTIFQLMIHLVSLTMFKMWGKILAHYTEMRLSSQLNNQVDYVFAVTVENDIGDGEKLM